MAKSKKLSEPEFTGAEAANALIRAFDFLRLDAEGMQAFESIIGHQFDEFSYSPDDYVTFNNTSWGRNYRKLEVGNGISFNIHITKYDSSNSRNTDAQFDVQIFCYYEKTYLETIRFVLDSTGNNPTHRDSLWSRSSPPVPMGKYDATSFWTGVKQNLRTKIRTILNANQAYLERSAFYDKMKTELNIKLRKK